MGNLYDYFAAPDDATALTVFRQGGPYGSELPGLFVKGVDPYVELGQAEGLLRGVSYDHVVELSRFNRLLSDPEADGRWLFTLTDELRDALAGATPERLREVAVPWSRIEEFGGGADPDGLAGFLAELAGLAHGARADGHRLYCAVTL